VWMRWSGSKVAQTRHGMVPLQDAIIRQGDAGLNCRGG
jgi:hypothetical protein